MVYAYDGPLWRNALLSRVRLKPVLLLPIMTAKTIYLGLIADLDTAIEMFQKEQGSATASLAVGDIWNGGSVDKWLKLAYLLKARYI